MRKTIVKIIVILTVTILIIQYMSVSVFSATEKENLKNEQNKINEQIEDAKQKKEEIEEEKSETMKSVENIIGKISDSESEIDNLENKISNLKTEIKNKQSDIKQKEKEYTEQEKLLDARIIAMYETGDTSYLTTLLTATSITDFISKYYYASELVEYDKQLIQQIKDQKAKIEEEKSSLESNKKELDTALAQSEQKNTELKNLKKEKETYANKLSEQEKEVQSQIEELQAANRKIANEIKQAEIRYQKQLEELARKQREAEAAKKKNGNSGSSVNNDSSTVSSGSGHFIRPVSGSVTATAYYSSGKFHGAIDFGVQSGTVVKAAADGVVMSTANLSGSYGTYVVIRHANGLQSYYAHGTPGSICVKAGDIVNQGQKIMLSGNSGNSRGPHLHFEVRKAPYNYSYGAKKYGEDSRVNPASYF